MSAPDPIEPLSPMVVGPSSRRIQAIGAVMYLIAAFLFALNGSVAKAQIEAGLSPAEVTEIRTIGCALLLLIYILIVNPGSLKVRRTEIPFLLLFGVLAYALTPFLFFLSVELLPVAIAALLAFLAPVLVALWLRYVKREAVGRSIWLSLVLVVGGLILVSQVWSGMTLNPLGVFFGLLTAAALAAYLILGEAGARRRDVMSLAFWGFAIATVTWSILAPWWNFPWNLLTTTTSLFDGAVTGIPVWSLVIVMIAISVIPFVLVLMSLQRIGAQRGGILGTTEPLWAALLAFILLGEVLSPIQGLGGLVVLAGVIVAEFASQRTLRAGALTR
ncbi:MAG: DMT family transporter [Candidatus Nanopelagicales bacterium]|jgi:drug/metabolite transporter (DMT)-like permease|nr:DMT family transporter [Candidatus Nanopelagicales bacterium]MDP4715190.1 DMT family transporter [Candidatus Nanopelagicales bacterium]MDP4907603.1 DMT family transporter [Candidatus Nanopelagicales bacterium]MDP4975282.1 DMT family transporter [Candidatus Nanopelagicales bacterium]